MWLKFKTILIFPKCKELSHFNKMCDVALHDIKYDPRGLFLENSLNFNFWNNYYYPIHVFVVHFSTQSKLQKSITRFDIFYTPKLNLLKIIFSHCQLSTFSLPPPPSSPFGLAFNLGPWRYFEKI